MKEQFVTYEIALKLKELGFDEECFSWFYKNETFSFIQDYKNRVICTNKTDNDFILTPLWQQAIDWFREQYNTVVNVYANASGYLFEIHDSAKIGGTHRYDSGFDGPNEGGCWDNYYEAREQAILKAIELISK